VSQRVASLLSVLLPSPDDTAMLRALLHSGQAGRDAWDVWTRRLGGPAALLDTKKGSLKRLAPLLHDAIRRTGASVSPDVLTYARAAYFREDLRARSFKAAAGDVLAVLNEAGVPLVVSRGAALAEVCYRDWALRHCHDLDLVVPDEALATAAAALRGKGRMRPDARVGERSFTHVSGLPEKLHAGLFAIPYYRTPIGAVFSRSVVTEVAGVPARVLTPPDALLHVCTHAASSRSRSTLRWVCDAWAILASAPSLDWDVLLETATVSRSAIPLWITLGYLAATLGAPVPRAVLDRLAREVDGAGAGAIDTALHGACVSAPSRRALVRRAPDWRTRLLVARWLALPSPSYLRWTRRLSSPWLLPLYYVYRPSRFAVSRLTRRRRASGRLARGAPAA
jgi:hypothetical protein